MNLETQSEGVVVDESQEDFVLEETSETGIDYGLLIEAIQGFPYLFDLKHKLYKDAKLKTQAWQQISELFHCSVEECMKTWKNLRDRFVKEKNKLASGAGAPETNWPYFEAMLFYNKFTRARNTFTTTQKKGPATAKDATSRSSSALSTCSRPSSSASVWSNVTLETMTSPECSRAESRASIHTASGNENTQNLYVEISDHKTSEGSATPTTSTVKKRKRESDDKMDQLMGMASTIANSFSARRRENANSTFVEYLYQELEKLSEEEAKQKRKEILLIFFES